jgi:pimeloyl-ACP methyl ester carboxylesterase
LQDSYRVINVELRGHGDSTAEGPFTLADLVDDWLAILDQEGIEQAVLCGLSTGGMTAMRVAGRAPDRVAGLALLDTNAAPETPFNRFQYGMLGWGYSNLGLLPKKTLLRKMYSPATLAARPDLGEAFLEQVEGFDRRRLGHAMKAVFGRSGFDVSPLSVPALVIVGEHDLATPPICARRMAEAIDGASLEIVPGAGHLTAEERPEIVSDLLEPFFERCFSAG